jgi:hypothetical protein
MLSRPLSILAQFPYRGPRKHGTRRANQVLAGT